MWAPNSWVTWCFSLGQLGWDFGGSTISYIYSRMGEIFMFSDLATDEGTMWEAQQYTPLLSRLKHTHKRKIIQYIVFFCPRLPTWTVHGDCKTLSVQIWCLSVGCLGHNGIISLDRCKQNNWIQLDGIIYVYIYIWQCVKTLYPWWTSK